MEKGWADIQHDDNSPVLRYVAVDPEAGWTHDIIDGEHALDDLPVNTVSHAATLGDRELPNYFRQSMTRTTGEVSTAYILLDCCRS